MQDIDPTAWVAPSALYGAVAVGPGASVWVAAMKTEVERDADLE